MKNDQTALAVKTNEEIKKIRRACEISSELHLLFMKSNCRGFSEVELAENIKKQFSQKYILDWAYPLIIGSGERANILHARPTKKIIKENDLVLVDAGIKHKDFCSDITRTWPVKDEFSPFQKTIYKIVLHAQKTVIKNIKPGKTLQQLHELCCETLKEDLFSQGLLKKKNFTDLFPHKTSHWIGKHVHDPCPYFDEDKNSVRLTAGMCFTVEPGLYLKRSGLDHKGLGVRIEDVVVVNERSCEVLSLAPKELEEIEELRRKSRE